MKKQILAVISLTMLFATSIHAEVSGKSSNTNYIRVGGTEYISENHGDSSVLGKPGIGVHTSNTPFKKVALSKLETLAKVHIGGSYNFSKGVAYVDENNWLNPHKDSGHYAFSKVSSGNTQVYFGEWSDEDNMTDGSHTVYYVGKDKTTSMPASGSATYTVKGINNVRNTNPLQGELVANFSNNTLNGSMNNGVLTVAIQNNTINPTTASFSGTALANGSITGFSQGEFFGDNAKALGGMATFGNNNHLDTAFAGTKK